MSYAVKPVKKGMNIDNDYITTCDGFIIVIPNANGKGYTLALPDTFKTTQEVGFVIHFLNGGGDISPKFST